MSSRDSSLLFVAGALLTGTLMAACGGKVFVDPGGTGAAGGAGGSGTGGGAANCDLLEKNLAQKLLEAQACDPTINAIQCSDKAIVKDGCGCDEAGNELNPAAVAASNDAYDTWVGFGCGPYECALCPPPPQSSPWYCDPTQKKCLPAFEK